MNQEMMVERLFEAAVNGNRDAAREIMQMADKAGLSPTSTLTEVLWPTHELVERLHRADQITAVAYHLATRLLRVLVDQAAARLDTSAPKTRTVFCVCGPSQGEELSAQMACDLLETAGFHVTFSGGGIPADEILAQVNERRPDVLLMFGSAAGDLPDIRTVIDSLKEIKATPHTRIVVGGGVFARAEGLAEEIGADMFVKTPGELVFKLSGMPERRALDRRVGDRRRRAA
jgi:methanogenic corrinoid protein MtbC1